MDPNKARVSIIYNGKEIARGFGSMVSSLDFTDVASGESDAISINLCNIDKRWIKSWMPKKGDKIGAKIYLDNWDKDSVIKVIQCGTFTLDDLSFSGRPLVCNIGAVSMPQAGGFNSQKKKKTWEKNTIEQIAKKIATKAKVKLYYEAKSIKITSIEQSDKTDCEFLSSICKDYGLAMKTYAGKICIYDEEKYEKRKAVVTLKESDMLTWTYNTTVTGTYTGAIITYTGSGDSKEIKIKIGKGERILKIDQQADSKADAELKGRAKLREENKKATTMSVTIRANPKIISSSCVNITTLEKLNGKYYVEKVKTKVGGGATNMQLELRYIFPPIEERKQADKEKDENGKDLGGKLGGKTGKDTKTSSTDSYTIKNGDTLWGIALKHLKNGSRGSEIYKLNKEVIEAEAKKRGKSSSENGKWIWAGTSLLLPE